MNRMPKRGEIWTNGGCYCYVFMVATDMGTTKKRVVFQMLNNEEEKVIKEYGGDIVVIKLGDAYSLDLKTFKEKMKLFKDAPEK